MGTSRWAGSHRGLSKGLDYDQDHADICDSLEVPSLAPTGSQRSTNAPVVPQQSTCALAVRSKRGGGLHYWSGTASGGNGTSIEDGAIWIEMRAFLEPCTGEQSGSRCAVEITEKGGVRILCVRGSPSHVGAHRLVLTERGGQRASSREISVGAGGLDVSKCVAEGGGLTRAVLGRPSSFVIRARDSSGNGRRLARSAPFRVSLLNGPGTVEASVTPAEDGSFLVVYTPLGAEGEYLLTVTYAAARIPGCPFRVRVTAPSSKASKASTSLLRKSTSTNRLLSLPNSHSRCRPGSAPTTGLALAQCPPKHTHDVTLIHQRLASTTLAHHADAPNSSSPSRPHHRLHRPSAGLTSTRARRVKSAGRSAAARSSTPEGSSRPVPIDAWASPCCSTTTPTTTL